jgi:hypothetical protein
LHARWLCEDRATLIAEVTAHDVPVALVLEHASDPLGTPEAVAGLADLLANTPSVSLLGTGVAGLAAIAFGAHWAAVGIRSSLRAFTPVDLQLHPRRRKRRWHPAPQEVLAAPVLSFRPVDVIIAASVGNPAWVCRCSRCHGRTPEWLASAQSVDADAHTIDVLLHHAERLRRRAPGPARAQAWRALCRQALSRYRELGLADLDWQPPCVIAAAGDVGTGQSALRSA